MKKITLIALLLFVGIVSALYLTTALRHQPNSRNSLTASNGQTTTNASALTKEDVARHATNNDCYLIINNKVYNVSSYIGQHPGGSRTITSRCGQEVTGIFASIHSNFAWDLLKKYYLGDISLGSQGTSSQNTTIISDTLNTIKKSLELSSAGLSVIDVKPKNDFYVVKFVQNGKLYEAHVDASGKVLQQEVANDEYDWNFWDSDSDDSD